jgi:hypothetical protein
VSGPRLDDSLTHHYSSFPLLLLVSFILKRNMNMKNFFNAAWLFFAVLATLASSEEYEESRNRLSESKPQSCELIIDRSRFYGTCCSLNATDSLGCVLNVANGWCRVSASFVAFYRLFSTINSRVYCSCIQLFEDCRTVLDKNMELH